VDPDPGYLSGISGGRDPGGGQEVLPASRVDYRAMGGAVIQGLTRGLARGKHHHDAARVFPGQHPPVEKREKIGLAEAETGS